MPAWPFDTCSFVKLAKEDPKSLIAGLEVRCEQGEGHIQIIHNAFPDQATPDVTLPGRYGWTSIDVLGRYLGRIYTVAGSPLYTVSGDRPLSLYRICGSIVLLRDRGEDWQFDRTTKNWAVIPQVLRTDWPLPVVNLLNVNMDLIKTGVSAATSTTAMTWRRFSQNHGGQRFPLMSMGRDAIRYKVVEHLVRESVSCHLFACAGGMLTRRTCSLIPSNLWPKVADEYEHGDRSDIKPHCLWLLQYEDEDDHGQKNGRQKTAIASQWESRERRGISLMMVADTVDVKIESRSGHTLLDVRLADGKRHIFVVTGMVAP
ncbi:hypothetical protein HD553DRAFT_187200 [Filobasidium floriforme]|uniref:uncharacterized protein n=1 Tax=Filobasidium floriforme TaxID=5210 RepID=UPI001E8EA1CF|nr:uncharacterized protein HD553DRAFT_187200 [Filobasidium floriforme]KAH8088051.1 hypothetical protein HD553DRAFT_187200 [Filobasidium floriforme]